METKPISMERWCCYIVIISSIVLIVLLVAVLFPLLMTYSYDSLEITEWGIEINQNTVEINNNTLYKGGSHYLGLNHYFLKFPKIYQNILIQKSNNLNSDFNENKNNKLYNQSLPVRSNDGLKLFVELSVTYQLGYVSGQVTSNPNSNNTFIDFNSTSNTNLINLDPLILEQLIILYKTIKFDWHNLVYKIANFVCKNVFSQYKSREIIANKTMLREAFKSELNRELFYRNITLMNANILKVEFPTEIKEAFEKIEILNQKQKQMAYRINSANIEIVDKINLTNYERSLLETESQIENQARTQVFLDKVNAREKYYSSIYNSFLNLKSQLKMQNKGTTIGEQLLAYYWVKIMQNRGNKNSKHSFNIPENFK